MLNQSIIFISVELNFPTEPQKLTIMIPLTKVGIVSEAIMVAVLYINLSPWASYQIRNIASCACAGNAGNAFPCCRLQRKLLVSDPGMHHGTCVTHVPWCMSGLLACDGGVNVPGILGACAPAIFRIWQEAHGSASSLIGYLLYTKVVMMRCQHVLWSNHQLLQIYVFVCRLVVNIV